jgi:hypothetical protein
LANHYYPLGDKNNIACIYELFLDQRNQVIHTTLQLID